MSGNVTRLRRADAGEIRPIGTRDLAARAGRPDADESAIVADAWRLLRGQVPLRIAEQFPRGGFLDATHELCEAVFGGALCALTLEYTSRGGPYRATLRLAAPDRIATGESARSAAMALIVALLDGNHNRP